MSSSTPLACRVGSAWAVSSNVSRWSNGYGPRTMSASDRNFIFGVGLGYRDVEFDAFGVPRGQRVGRFEQCLEVVKRLWTEDNVSFRSEFHLRRRSRLSRCRVRRLWRAAWAARGPFRAMSRGGQTAMDRGQCQLQIGISSSA